MDAGGRKTDVKFTIAHNPSKFLTLLLCVDDIFYGPQ
jgi:hypothetical protein